LREVDFLRDPQVQVPEWESRHRPTTADLTIQAQDWAADWIAECTTSNRASCIGVAEHIKTRPAGAASRSLALFFSRAVVQVLRDNTVLQRAYEVGVAFAEATTVAVRCP